MKSEAAVYQWKAIRDLAQQIERLERAFHGSEAIDQYYDIIGKSSEGGAGAIWEAADWMAENTW